MSPSSVDKCQPSPETEHPEPRQPGRSPRQHPTALLRHPETARAPALAWRCMLPGPAQQRNGLQGAGRRWCKGPEGWKPADGPAAPMRAAAAACALPKLLGGHSISITSQGHARRQQHADTFRAAECQQASFVTCQQGNDLTLHDADDRDAGVSTRDSLQDAASQTQAAATSSCQCSSNTGSASQPQATATDGWPPALATQAESGVLTSRASPSGPQQSVGAATHVQHDRSCAAAARRYLPWRPAQGQQAVAPSRRQGVQHVCSAAHSSIWCSSSRSRPRLTPPAEC